MSPPKHRHPPSAFAFLAFVCRILSPLSGSLNLTSLCPWSPCQSVPPPITDPNSSAGPRFTCTQELSPPGELPGQTPPPTLPLPSSPLIEMLMRLLRLPSLADRRAGSRARHCTCQVRGWRGSAARFNWKGTSHCPATPGSWDPEAAQSSCSPVVPEAVEEVAGGWRPGLEKRAQEEIGKAGEEVRQAQRTWHREGDPKRSRRQLGQEGVRAGASHTVREEKGKRERQLSQALCLLWRPRRR